MTPIITVEHLSKRYRLGLIGATTLRESAERWVEKSKSCLRRSRHQPAVAAPPAESDLWALRDVSFEVMPGEVLGIIGRNGAGKSTLLKILSRITEPTSGQARIRGRVASLLEIGTGFHPELTGRENIFLNGAILGMKKPEIHRKFDEIVAFSEVERFIDTPVKRYSSGMYVRLAFAVAAHLEPEILIVDEVLAVGDASFQKKCLGRMQTVAGEGHTVLFVSHNMVSIARLCGRAMLLSAGKCVDIGGSEQVVQAYLNGLETAPAASFVDLRDAKRQERNPRRILEWVSLHTEHGERVTDFRTGDTVCFQIGYRCDDVMPAYCRINIINAMGERLVGLASLHVGPPLMLKGTGVIECVMRDIRLITGEYTVMLEVGRQFPHIEWLDCVPDAVRLRVKLGKYLGGTELASGQGTMAQRAEWRTEVRRSADGQPRA